MKYDPTVHMGHLGRCEPLIDSPNTLVPILNPHRRAVLNIHSWTDVGRYS